MRENRELQEHSSKNRELFTNIRWFVYYGGSIWNASSWKRINCFVIYYFRSCDVGFVKENLFYWLLLKSYLSAEGNVNKDRAIVRMEGNMMRCMKRYEPDQRMLMIWTKFMLPYQPRQLRCQNELVPHPMHEKRPDGEEYNKKKTTHYYVQRKLIYNGRRTDEMMTYIQFQQGIQFKIDIFTKTGMKFR